MKDVVIERTCQQCLDEGRPRERAYGVRHLSSAWEQTDVDAIARRAVIQAAAAEGVDPATYTPREKARIALPALREAGIPFGDNGRPVLWSQADEDALGTSVDVTWASDLAAHIAREHLPKAQATTAAAPSAPPRSTKR